MASGPVLFLLVGLPGSGKTTRAREIERTHRALRFSPDEWMLPLFGESDPDGKRDIMEGRLIWVALRAIQAGISAILDFGFWAQDERSALVLQRDIDLRLTSQGTRRTLTCLTTRRPNDFSRRSLPCDVSRRRIRRILTL